VIARSEGVTAALITCDDSNVASSKVIESCGGVLEKITLDEDGVAFRRYWI
jgi:predicted acetyltransferase